jgi:hypothetical protein
MPNAAPTPTLTRRRVLAGAAAGVAATAVAVPALAGAITHPDAALLATWSNYMKAYRAFDHAYDVLLPDGGTDADHEPHYQAIEFYEDQIERHQASTVDGFAVQLRYLFAKNMGCADSLRAAVYGEPVSEDLAAELDLAPLDKMLWNMIQAAARASRGTSTVRA